MPNPEPPRVTTDTRADATICDDGERHDSNEANKPKRRKIDYLLRYTVGTIVFVPATSWHDYNLHWPYNFPLERAYVKGKSLLVVIMSLSIYKEPLYMFADIVGVCTAVNRDEETVTIRFDAFDLDVQQKAPYLKKFCKQLDVLPTSGFEITKQLYDLNEGGDEVEEHAALPRIGDSIFVVATAWKSTNYKHQWPYESPIEKSFFRAVIGERKVAAKFQVIFDAFQLEAKDEVFSYTLYV
jgi:hypothetical protein